MVESLVGQKAGWLGIQMAGWSDLHLVEMWVDAMVASLVVTMVASWGENWVVSMVEM